MRRSARQLGRAAPASGEVELLRAALLADDELAAAAWHRWRVGHDVQSSRGRMYSLLPAVSARLPPEVLGADGDVMRGLRRRVWAATQLQLVSLAGALAVLDALDDPPIVAKGAALVSGIYRRSGVRSMSDCDVIVGAGQFDAATRLLVDAGWVPAADFENQPFMHASSFSDGHSGVLDLHRWVVFPRFSRVVETGFFERAQTSSIQGAPCRRLALPDELVLCVVHGLGPARDSGVRWVLDVAEILAAAAGDGSVGPPEAFWSDVVESARELAVGEMMADGLGWADAQFGWGLPGGVLAELREISSDRLLAGEWWLRRRGVVAPMRTRQYLDTERLAGRRPTLGGYAGIRAQAVRRSGGVFAATEKRVAKLTASFESRRVRARE